MSIPPLWQVGGAGGPYKRAHGASLSQKADFSRFSQIAHPRLGAYYSPMTSVSSLDPGPSLNVHPSLGLLRSNYVALVLCFRCTISCRPPFPASSSAALSARFQQMNDINAQAHWFQSVGQLVAGLTCTQAELLPAGAHGTHNQTLL